MLNTHYYPWPSFTQAEELGTLMAAGLEAGVY